MDPQDLLFVQCSVKSDQTTEDMRKVSGMLKSTRTPLDSIHGSHRPIFRMFLAMLLSGEMPSGSAVDPFTLEVCIWVEVEFLASAIFHSCIAQQGLCDKAQVCLDINLEIVIRA